MDNDIVKVRNNQLWGLQTTAGKELLPAIYEKIFYVRRFHSYIIRKDKKYGLFDPVRAVLTDLKYQHISPHTHFEGMNDGYEVKTEKGLGWIDLNGKVLIPPQYYRFKGILERFFQASTDYHNHYDLYDQDGNLLIKGPLYEVEAGKENVLIVCKYVKMAAGSGFYDALFTMAGEPLTEFKYTHISAAKNGLFHSREKVLQGETYAEKWGVLDPEGKEIVPFIYDQIEASGEQYIWVKKDGRCGLLDHNGKIVIPMEYDSVGDMRDGYTYALKDDKCGLINDKNERIVPFRYQALGDVKDRTVYWYRDGEAGYLDLDQDNREYTLTKVADDQYRYCDDQKMPGRISRPGDVRPLIENSISFEQDGMHGFIDGDGKVFIPAIYEDCSSCFYGGLAFVKSDGKWGIINREGQWVAPPEYDLIGFIMKGFCLGKKGDSMDLISTAGVIYSNPNGHIGYSHKKYNQELKKWEQSPGGDWMWYVFNNGWYLQDRIDSDHVITQDIESYSILKTSSTEIDYFEVYYGEGVTPDGEYFMEDPLYDKINDPKLKKSEFQRVPPDLIETAGVRTAKNRINSNHANIYDPYYINDYYSGVAETLIGTQNRYLMAVGVAVSQWILWRIAEKCEPYLDMEAAFQKLEALTAAIAYPYIADSYLMNKPEIDCEAVLVKQYGEDFEYPVEVGVLDTLLMLWEKVYFCFQAGKYHLETEVDRLVILARMVLSPKAKKIFNQWLKDIIEQGRNEYSDFLEGSGVSGVYYYYLDDLINPDCLLERQYHDVAFHHKQFLEKLETLDWENNPYLIQKEYLENKEKLQ